MANEPGSISSLRAYYNVSATEFDPSELIKTVSKESDRSAVVITASILEDRLTAAIKAKLRPMDEKEMKELALFKYNGPIGSFSAKIDIGYALGVVDADTRGELHDIRQMRNACAHSIPHIGFDTPELANVCKRLFLPGRSFWQLPSDEPEALRNFFILECSSLNMIFSHGSREEAAAVALNALAELDEE